LTENHNNSYIFADNMTEQALLQYLIKHYPKEDADTNSLYNQVLRKLKEMDDKQANYYTNFF